ncbi:hypothetical protein [Actinomadura rugatobispora]|uniref:Uncharacterized protein n=1 Tax=Actinomadura rugatobispora TaxID=1994 RepID=A0ABW1A5H7_9ACTN|nr:hypothetical protein GCM10010200_018160 [Actinomadura rugatobispora]
MIRRAAHSKPGRHGFLPRPGVRGTLHSWAALTCVIELHAEGIHRLPLTLPVVIIALLDAWHEFQIIPSTSDNSSAPGNHGKRTSENGH